MYILLGIDTVIRITLALVLLFVVVPALAWRRPRELGRLEWFWWCLGCGMIALTLAGQLFTLLNIAGTLTYLLLLAAIVIVLRARRLGMSPLQWIARAYHDAVRFSLHVLDGRASLRRRFARARRRTRTRIAAALHEHRAAVAIWSSIALVAAAVRLYRPFATANLGFSDTYVHLYLMRLLDAGRQVDPAWGPYPRGMHFLLLAIERLTNADEILLMNFFGAFAGVLMTLSAAYAAKRAANNSNAAALVAGLIFATMIGGPHQYFAFGGSVSTDNPSLARSVLAQRYDDLASYGEFDVLLTAFARQTSTLPQELAIALLFPAALFFLDWLRDGNRWRLAGFILCTASIAATHSGVVIPLVLLCGAAALVAVWRGLPGRRRADILSAPRAGSPLNGGPEARATLSRIFRGMLAGAVGIALGSTWMLGFLRYRSSPHVDSTAQYYFPFLRPPELAADKAWMMFTPFLIAMLIAAAALAIRGRSRPAAVWLAIATALFILTHAASVIGIPEIVEVRRNASWLAMSVAALLGATIVSLTSGAPASRRPEAARRRLISRRDASAPAAAIAILAWLATIPNFRGAYMKERLLDYSGYGATTYAVVRLSAQLEPFTWTLVSYGQEYPMVLGRGFHLSGADFLERYDPAMAPLPIPTPYVFIAVEKTPHRFQINTWATRFDRGAIEERLETWCTLYRMTHNDMRVWLDDEHVRVYAIERRPEVAALGAR